MAYADWQVRFLHGVSCSVTRGVRSSPIPKYTGGHRVQWSRNMSRALKPSQKRDETARDSDTASASHKTAVPASPHGDSSLNTRA